MGRAWQQVMMMTMMMELCLAQMVILWMMGSGTGELMIEIKGSSGITSKMQNTTLGKLLAIAKIFRSLFPSIGMT